MLATNAHAPEVAEPLSSWSTTRYVRVSSRVGESMLFLVVRARAGCWCCVSCSDKRDAKKIFFRRFLLFLSPFVARQCSRPTFGTNLVSSRTLSEQIWPLRERILCLRERVLTVVLVSKWYLMYSSPMSRHAGC